MKSSEFGPDFIENLQQLLRDGSFIDLDEEDILQPGIEYALSPRTFEELQGAETQRRAMMMGLQDVARSAEFSQMVNSFIDHFTHRLHDGDYNYKTYPSSVCSLVGAGYERYSFKKYIRAFERKMGKADELARCFKMILSEALYRSVGSVKDAAEAAVKAGETPPMGLLPNEDIEKIVGAGAAVLDDRLERTRSKKDRQPFGALFFRGRKIMSPGVDHLSPMRSKVFNNVAKSYFSYWNDLRYEHGKLTVRQDREAWYDRLLWVCQEISDAYDLSLGKDGRPDDKRLAEEIKQLIENSEEEHAQFMEEVANRKHSKEEERIHEQDFDCQKKLFSEAYENVMEKVQNASRGFNDESVDRAPETLEAERADSDSALGAVGGLPGFEFDPEAEGDVVYHQFFDDNWMEMSFDNEVLRPDAEAERADLRPQSSVGAIGGPDSQGHEIARVREDLNKLAASVTKFGADVERFSGDVERLRFSRVEDKRKNAKSEPGESKCSLV